MKNLVNFINEKFLIDDNFKDDFSASIHQYTIKEMFDIFDKYSNYSVNFILTDPKGKDIKLDNHYLVDTDAREILNVLDSNVKDNVIKAINNDSYKSTHNWTPKKQIDQEVKALDVNNATNIICLEKVQPSHNTITAFSLYRNANNIKRDKSFYKIGLFILDWYNNELYKSVMAWNTRKIVIVYKTEVDDKYKELTLYLTFPEQFKSMAAKETTNYRGIDKNASPEYFDRKNETNLQTQIKNKNIDLSRIPDKYKYFRGKSKAVLFWKVYVTLAIYGDMKKQEVLEIINKLTGSDMLLTSYSTSFADWSNNRRIRTNNGLLTPIPYDDWKNK